MYNNAYRNQVRSIYISESNGHFLQVTWVAGSSRQAQTSRCVILSNTAVTNVTGDGSIREY